MASVSYERFITNISPVAFRLIPLNIVVFLGFMTVSLPLPVLPVFVSSTMTTSPLVVGLVIGLQSIVTVLTRRRAGLTADTKGPRVATARGLFICACVGIVYIVLAAAPVSWTIKLVILLGGRVLLGVGESLILTGAITWGIACVGSTKAGQVMSWNGIAMYAALAGGAPLGLIIYKVSNLPDIGFVLLGTAAALLPLGALCIVLKLPSVHSTPSEQLPLRLLLRRIWPFGVALTLQMVGFGTISSFLSLTYESHKWNGAGLAFVGFGIAVICVRLACGGFPDRVGGKPVAIASLAIVAIGQTILWFAPMPLIALIGSVFTGMGVALAFPALGIEAIKNAPLASKGQVVGIFSAFQDIAFGVTGPVAGLIAMAYGYQSVFAFGVFSSLFALALLISLQQGRVT